MKKFLKISFISLSVFVLSFIVVAVLLSNKVSASNDDVKEDTSADSNPLVVEVVKSNELTISNDSSASITYNLTFEGVSEEGSFENASITITYTENSNDTTVSHSEQYYSGTTK